ncbi:MAG: ATP-binding cassette domain-containing protein [Anaerolineaceae bacterium]|nr:ATP-binding cassette domain-containing protein [Anaerolineaceae bacterium]
MSVTAISIEDVSKLYHIGSLQHQHNTMRDALVDGVQSLLQRLRRNGALSSSEDTIWALKDVSFEVGCGEVVGIIGRNGAGKSTLLKILSRVTEPTEGRAVIHGRVGSLLEVGTGFHPELSGRENIYLNGAILGMKRAEIVRKFDEIVAFAEIDKFIDTPVKRYSSGMYVRLAFAVAAHLEPEILLVDEVLAVGDATFQKKCLGKMDDVATAGRTVLFVSHNMSAVQRLCARSVMLDGGRVVAEGPTPDVVAEYLAVSTYTASPEGWVDLSSVSRTGTGQARFAELWYSSQNEMLGCKPYSGGPLEFALSIVSDAARSVGSLAVTVYDQHGTKLVNADTVALGRTVALEQGSTLARLRIDELHLNPGVYVVGLWLANPAGEVFDHVKSAIKIEVVEIEPKGDRLGVRARADGVVVCNFDFETCAAGARPGSGV